MVHPLSDREYYLLGIKKTRFGLSGNLGYWKGGITESQGVFAQRVKNRAAQSLSCSYIKVNHQSLFSRTYQSIFRQYFFEGLKEAFFGYINFLDVTKEAFFATIIFRIDPVFQLENDCKQETPIWKVGETRWEKQITVGKRTKSIGKGTKPVGKVTKAIGKGTKPIGKGTKPVGKRTKPIEKRTKPVGKGTKPIGKRTKPVGKRTKPIGKETKPVRRKEKRFAWKVK